MTKIYRIGFFVLGMLMLIGIGVGFSVHFADARLSSLQGIDSLKGEAWKPILAAEAVAAEATWPEAPKQSSDWVYEIFTPPKIYIDSAGNFSIVPIRDPVSPPPFDLHLVEMHRLRYRIQLEGYIEEDFSDPSKRLFLFYDIEAKKSLRLRTSGHSDESEFEVRSLEVSSPTIHEDGSLVRIASAVILDRRDGLEYKLLNAEPLYQDKLNIVLQSNKDPSIKVVLQAVEESFETPMGHYTLDAIDLEAKTATVTRHKTEVFEARTKVLQLNDSKKDSIIETNDEATFDLF